MRPRAAAWGLESSIPGSFADLPPFVESMCHSIKTVAEGRVSTARDVAATIAGYRPRSVPEEAACFARAAVAAAAPPRAARAKALLWACAKLGAFGCSVGLDPSFEVLLHPSTIERLVLVGAADLSGAARRTLRTNLRFVAHRVLPGVSPHPVALSRERAKAPYTESEIATYLALASAQPTAAGRMRASGLVCLGAGAGLMGADLRDVRGSDVIARSGGVVVEVRGRRPRVVPVLRRYHTPLQASADFAGFRYVVGGTDRDRHNVTTPLVSRISGGGDLARLDTGRLRATWLSTQAVALGLGAFMDAAGIICSQRLGDLVPGLPATEEAAAVALLGGTR